ncbi:MAG: ABC transporter permease [Acidimicrobiales bacterium]
MTSVVTQVGERQGAPEAVTRPRVGAFAALIGRRLRLNLRNPRAILLPLATPVLIAVVIAPALAKLTGSVAGVDYVTYLAVGTIALVVPLSCMQAGLGVIVDRHSGAQPDLLAAPVSRGMLVMANLVAALVASALQVVTLLFFAWWRGAVITTSAFGVLWFVGAVVALGVAMYGIAETLANRIGSEAEYVNAIPTIGIAPWFFAGSLFSINAMPGWIAAIAKVLPATQALALMRYGLVDHDAAGLHDIWGLSSPSTMAALSLAVLVAYAVLFAVISVTSFKKAAVR